MFDFDYLFEWRLRLNEITSNYVHILDVLVSLAYWKASIQMLSDQNCVFIENQDFKKCSGSGNTLSIPLKQLLIRLIRSIIHKIQSI